MRFLFPAFTLCFLSLATSSQLALPRNTPNPNGITLPIFNDFAHQHYLINISVGTPPSLYSVLLDTGSTDFWLPAWNSSGCTPDPCKPGTFNPADSSSAVDIHVPFNVSYGLTPGSGMLGEYYNENISVGNAVIKNQTFAIANVPAPITPSTFWGILGLGSRYSTSSFTSPWSPVFHQLNATYTPLWESLFETGLVPRHLFSIYLNRQSADVGTITFGAIEGPESGKYEGELETVPVLLSGPLFTGWAVNLTSVTRTTTHCANSSSGAEPKTEPLTPDNFTIQVVLDTGAPNMYLPTPLYAQIAAPLTPTYHKNPEGNPTPYVRCALRNVSQPYLSFSFGGGGATHAPTIRVPYDELIYPFGLPANLGEVRGEDGAELCYFGVVETPGPVFLLGATFLRSVYAVFGGEAGEWRVGMAQARYGGGWDADERL